MDIFGSFALLLAFLAAVYAFGAGIAGILTRRTLLTKSARNAGMAVFVLVTLAVASLEYFFFTDNFSMAYVAAHSNRALPCVLQICRALGRPGRFAALVELAAFDLRLLRAFSESQEASRTDALCGRRACRACRYFSSR